MSPLVRFCVIEGNGWALLLSSFALELSAQQIADVPNVWRAPSAGGATSCPIVEILLRPACFPIRVLPPTCRFLDEIRSTLSARGAKSRLVMEVQLFPRRPYLWRSTPAFPVLSRVPCSATQSSRGRVSATGYLFFTEAGPRPPAPLPKHAKVKNPPPDTFLYRGRQPPNLVSHKCQSSDSATSYSSSEVSNFQNWSLGTRPSPELPADPDTKPIGLTTATLTEKSSTICTAMSRSCWQDKPLPQQC